VAKALVATFCIVCSVVAVAELRARAAIHRLLIHLAELKWLHVDLVVALAQAVEPKWLHRADQVVQLQAVHQAAALKSLRAVRLQAAELKARAADLADRFFRLSRLSFAG